MPSVPESVSMRWRSEGLWLDRTLAQAFAGAVAARPDAELTIISELRPASIRLRALFEQAHRVAGGLQAMGIESGDIVAVQMPNWLETVLAHAAVGLLGAAVLPIVHIYGRSEVEYILRQSGAKALITPEVWQGVNYLERVAAVRQVLPTFAHVVVGEAPEDAVSWSHLATHPPILATSDVDADRLALLVYTSGTTSNPKGVKHSHRTWLAEVMTATSGKMAEVSLSPWPPGHLAGVLGLARFWLAGQRTVLMDRWDALKAADLIAPYGITSTGGTPFHLASLLDAADAKGLPLSSLANYVAGGTTIPPALIQRCEARGLRTYRTYGLSEHPTISRGSPADLLEKRLNTDGRLCPGVDVIIVNDEGRALPIGEEGEILSRGPERFVGYSDSALDEGVLLADGWLRTGDIGRLDAEGFLAVTDRKKDVIIRGGENIASREVEDILSLLSGVREAAVVGMPHPTLGEKVCAFLVLEPDRIVTLETVAAHFQVHGVARQKTPEKIIIVEELPRNATGKVIKPELRAIVRASGAV